MLITHTKLKLIMPNVSYEDVMKHLPSIQNLVNNDPNKMGITTVKRFAAFIANVAHESGELSAGRENMNYSAVRLKQVFGKYFKPDQLSMYANKPEMIADRVYANRNGNGNELSGDGWKYRGGGAIQATGKAMYQLLTKHIGGGKIDFVKDPDKVIEPPYYILSAAYIWHAKGLNTIIDHEGTIKVYGIKINDKRTIYLNPFEYCCYKINGGMNGIEQRKSFFKKALQVL